MPVPGRVMRRLTWIGLNRGLAYELIVLGDQSEIELPQLRGYADELWAGFALIDPEAGAVDPVPLEAVFRSPTFGYTVELTDPEWERWPDAAGTVVGAEFGATHPLGVMVVIPIALLGVDPTQEGVAAAFSRVLDLADGGDTRPVRVGPLTGIDVEGQRAAAEPLRERTRILVGEASAFAVTVVMSEETARLDELLGEVRAFSLETDPVLETSADVPESLRLGHAIFFAALASHQRRSGRLADAETTMERSVELAPSDPSALAILAAIQLERARYAAAVATYEQVFAGDYSNVDAVEGYVSALLELGRPDEALEVLDEQIRRSGSGQLRLTRAVVLAQQGDLARATAELESLEREGYASVLLYELMFAFYLEQDRPADVARHARSARRAHPLQTGPARVPGRGARRAGAILRRPGGARPRARRRTWQRTSAGGPGGDRLRAPAAGAPLRLASSGARTEGCPLRSKLRLWRCARMGVQSDR